ncbi:hypothetical protein ACWEKM_18650 [Streptomyces sp. NPDC004752]
MTVLRPDPDPGFEAQVDYGLLGSWTDPRTGRSQRMWAFVMVLSHSRHMFVRPVVSMDQASWAASDVEAFAFFGGAPVRLVPDNLKTGVDNPDLYDPKINRFSVGPGCNALVGHRSCTQPPAVHEQKVVVDKERQPVGRRPVGGCSGRELGASHP